MFVPFGASHLIALALTIAAAGIVTAVGRLWNAPRPIGAVRAALAALLTACWAIWFLFVYARGWISIATLLPLHLCDWATIVVTITLVYPNQRTYELAYFWAMGGTLQALLTPALFQDFPSLGFLVFFTLHGGVIVSVAFLTLVLGLRPWPSSIPRVVGWSLVYLATALSANAIFDTNFGFLSGKPAAPSLLDYLGPWPIYVAEEILLAGALIAFLYAPFYLYDRIVARRARR